MRIFKRLWNNAGRCTDCGVDADKRTTLCHEYAAYHDIWVRNSLYPKCKFFGFHKKHLCEPCAQTFFRELTLLNFERHGMSREDAENRVKDWKKF